MRLSVCVTLVAATAVWRVASAATLDDVTRAAIDSSPTLEASRARTAELRALASAARTWSDPVVTVELSNLPTSDLSLDAHPMAGVQFRVSQTLPPPGLPGRKAAVADTLAAQSELAVAEAELALREAIARGWWELTLARQLREVTERHLDVTDELVSVARSRYEVGSTGQHAVVRLELLRDRLVEDLADLGTGITVMQASLAAAASDPELTFDTPVQTEPVPPVADAAQWVEVARTARPMLASLEARATASEQAAAVARASAIPSPTVSAGYRVRVAQGVDPGDDFVSLGVSLPLPLGSGKLGGARADAHLFAADRARAEHHAAVDAMLGQAVAIQARWQRAWDKTGAYRETLLPGAERALQTTLADYRVGRADFGSLYQAQVQLLEAERAARTAAVETRLEQARARALIGADPEAP